MLRVTELACQRNEQELFSNLNFEVNPGSLLLITGANGAGKSSLLKILAGLLAPSEGTLYWQEETLSLMNTRFLSELIYLGHKTGLSLALTPLENLNWWSSNINKNYPSDPQAIKLVLNTLDLIHCAHKPCHILSAGLKQKVALARLWIQPAKLWLLDEPFTAVDTEGQKLFLEHLSQHLQNGGMAVIASHIPIHLNQHDMQNETLNIVKQRNTIC